MNRVLFIATMVAASSCDLFLNEQNGVPGCLFVLDVAENMPVLLGGIAQVRSQITYPPEAIADSIEGRVIVDFVVNKNGKAIELTTRTNFGYGLEEEAIKVVRLSNFTIPMNYGKPTCVNYALPITFSID